MNARFTPLDHEALLQISGPDTLTFLQGQSTCDTGQLNDTHALTGLFCNPQGRAYADFLLVQLDEERVLLRLRRGIAVQTMETLGKYIAFSKAALEDASGSWATYGLWGDDAADCVREVFGASPDARHTVTAGNRFRLVQLDDAGTAYECLLANDSEQLDRLTAKVPEGTVGEWDALPIEAGIARLEQATAGEFVPQNLNYDLTGHISFTKGCYTGQEVVARLHYRGKSKRRVLVGSTETASPAPGDTLFAPGHGKPQGVVVNTADAGHGTTQLLVCTSPEHIETGLVTEGDAAKIALSLPPYPLDA